MVSWVFTHLGVEAPPAAASVWECPSENGAIGLHAHGDPRAERSAAFLRSQEVLTISEPQPRCHSILHCVSGYKA